jgi:hypothetical protein
LFFFSVPFLPSHSTKEYLTFKAVWEYDNSGFLFLSDSLCLRVSFYRNFLRHSSLMSVTTNRPSSLQAADALKAARGNVVVATRNLAQAMRDAAILAAATEAVDVMRVNPAVASRGGAPSSAATAADTSEAFMSPDDQAVFARRLYSESARLQRIGQFDAAAEVQLEASLMIQAAVAERRNLDTSRSVNAQCDSFSRLCGNL